MERLAQRRQRREPVLKGALKCKSEQRLSAKYEKPRLVGSLLENPVRRRTIRIFKPRAPSRFPECVPRPAPEARASDALACRRLKTRKKISPVH